MSDKEKRKIVAGVVDRLFHPSQNKCMQQNECVKAPRYNYNFTRNRRCLHQSIDNARKILGFNSIKFRKPT